MSSIKAFQRAINKRKKIRSHEDILEKKRLLLVFNLLLRIRRFATYRIVNKILNNIYMKCIVDLVLSNALRIKKKYK